MTPPPIFVVAPTTRLPDGTTSPEDLQAAQAEPEVPTSLQCLDRVALSALSNATCWLYPTHDGTFLSPGRGVKLTLQQGSIADCPEELASAPYERCTLSLLWSLLGTMPASPVWGSPTAVNASTGRFNRSALSRWPPGDAFVATARLTTAWCWRTV